MIIQNAPLEIERARGKVLPYCYICEQVPERGIKGVLKLGRKFICRECENKIITCDINSPDYEKIIKIIKELWK